ncbi:phosphonopyruvate decarboxylase [Arenibacter sp. N53]|uniref:phosphonopyruvate decarboxylase n=1 Tax=Arenibacter TaxID=178469 RepID=UPI000CD41A5D|nr:MULTISPECIES: phosphonopyruvate decarboxylase [Arenibacter]MCM4150233.1 phosphonopyruvate decarboxylase [Arenibacter sp. N53]
MIDPSKFYNALLVRGINFFTGVPDSLLKDICAYISDRAPEERHIISANEGTSVGLAVGNYLASGNIPLVYMQNSGFGNTVNPILSIADNDVYGIPMILLIGWRGEPGIKDEPQHIKQGMVSEDLLNAMKLPYLVVDGYSDIELVLDKAIHTAKSEMKPFALLVRKNSFEKYSLKKSNSTRYPLNREGAVKLIIDQLGENDIVVSTTGKTSREVFEYRKALQQTHEKDFLTVGAMGHTSSIAMGIAIEKEDRSIICIDGDGSVIMHMGSLTINGSMKKLKNFKHIVINNGAHDSVGGQPTVALAIDLPNIAAASGYSFVESATEVDDIKNKLSSLMSHHGRAFLEIKVNIGARENLGRPTTSPKENKYAFEKFLKKNDPNTN